MTRRVSFSPFLRAGLFAAGGLLASVAPSRGSDVPFTAPPPVSTTADGANDLRAADVDGDGDLDLVASNGIANALTWYENTAGNGSAWTLQTIATLASPVKAFVADVDGDGDLDALAAGQNESKDAWFENTAGDGSAWSVRTITTLSGGTRSLTAADVDGDGDQDAVSARSAPDLLLWYENTNGAGTAWTTRTIATSSGFANVVAGADVDGDGDLDLLSGGSMSGLRWYENSAGNGTAWSLHTINAGILAYAVSSADVDGDGDVDAVSGASFGPAAWYENLDGAGGAWAQHIIDTGVLGLSTRDVDGDGDLDAVTGRGGVGVTNAVVWYENTAGDASVWLRHTVSTAVDYPISVSAADLDGDGDPDILSASSNDDRIAWYRNDAIHESACFSTRTPVATSLGLARAVAPADVDGDGDRDALVAVSNVAGPPNPQLLWAENLAGDGSLWASHAIATGNNQMFTVVAADVDGDGDTDAISIGYYSGLRFWRNDAGDGSAWTEIPIGTTGFDTAAADIDGDGDPDALTSTNFFNPYVHWWENVAGGGGPWPFHTIASFLTTPWGASYSVSAADIDGDGDMDVLTHNGYFSTPGFWFENVAGNGSTWNTHTLPNPGLTSLFPADVDGDGDQDIVTNSPFAWLENTSGSGASWDTHAIGGSPGPAVSVADLDRDGDADLLTGGNGPFWAESTAGDGSAWASHPLPGGDAVFGVSVADLDGDGDPDPLGTSAAGGGHLDWFENLPGQFSLAGSDISPGGAANGDLVPLIRIDATHLGRAGDSDLELATLGLLFEEASGDPLTSAEANALVENLHLYLDANGNGAFDPGTDTLVATVATLTLVNGVQTVTLADGDPNLQVAFGTPRTYFVVTALTGDAGGQTPNQFQVTHLGRGPAASTAEDRSHDIPLRAACPGNVTAATGPITPVELSGFGVE